MTDGINDKVSNNTLSKSEQEATPDQSPKKLITLTRTSKSTSLLKVKDTSGKAKTIKVQVRKKRTFVKSKEGLIDEETNRENQAREKKLQALQEQQRLAKQEKTLQEQMIQETKEPETPAKEIAREEEGLTADLATDAIVETTDLHKKEEHETKSTKPLVSESKSTAEETVILTAAKAKTDREKKNKVRNIKEKEMTKYRHKGVYLLEDEQNDFRPRKKGGRQRRADQLLQQQFEKPTAAVKYEVIIPEIGRAHV